MTREFDPKARPQSAETPRTSEQGDSEKPLFEWPDESTGERRVTPKFPNLLEDLQGQNWMKFGDTESDYNATTIEEVVRPFLPRNRVVWMYRKLRRKLRS